MSSTPRPVEVIAALLMVMTPVAASAAPSVAVPGFAGVNMGADRIDFLGEHTAQMLRNSGMTVVTKKEIAVMLGIERQKQLLGCTDDAVS